MIGTYHESCLSPSLPKLHNALLGDPPSVPNPESVDLSGVQQMQQGVLSNLQELTAFVECHNFGYISVHNIFFSFSNIGL